ncbi:hypothetical protein AAFF_G00065810 [Aldrovandia affinis]|uniref:Uncharacterized protein n=1 Tax=Aldrovandia affinis TaxID=143900 RepID=A0AAD7WYV4_9TELE|nr:hypothetical protein AAFF_G00065810 [Aldrovandia affinis]
MATLLPHFVTCSFATFVIAVVLLPGSAERSFLVPLFYSESLVQYHEEEASAHIPKGNLAEVLSQGEAFAVVPFLPFLFHL